MRDLTATRNRVESEQMVTGLQQLTLPNVRVEPTEKPAVVNVASVPHRSPFRYPGGKTWLVPVVRRWVASLPCRPRLFCEPFCGGAIAGLSVLFEEQADDLVLGELDEDVAAVWDTVLIGRGDDLVNRIGEFEISEESVRAVLGRE